MKRYIRASVDRAFDSKLEDLLDMKISGLVNDLATDIYAQAPLEEEDDRAESFVAILESDDEVLDAEYHLLKALRNAYRRQMRWD